MKDLTIVGNVLLSDGIGRQMLGLLETLDDSMSINCLKQEPIIYKGITNPKTLETLQKPFDGFGKTTIWTYILGLNRNIIETHKKISSNFKIAYSMIESDAIPSFWTEILNKYYDIVVVPDKWLVNVYKNSGVNIPIFVLPLGIYLPEKINPTDVSSNKPLIFGMTGGFWERKNHIKTMKCFQNIFKDSNQVKLLVHGRFGSYKEKVMEAYKQIGSPKNIELVTEMLPTDQYNSLMNSIDVYVFLSKGEGYSITPREAIYLGKPVILSKNTAHRTICDSGFVIPVESNNKIPAFYEIFNRTIGHVYDCEDKAVENAMLNSYNHYEEYKQNVLNGGKEWVEQFSWQSLKQKYITLCKPTNMVLGKENRIYEDHIETNNKKLYNKIKKEFNI